jgi:hypothetical protein
LPGVEPGLGGGKPAKPASLSRTRVADENRERSWVFLPAVAPESPAPRQTNAWDIDPDKARQQAPPR